jgi:hypothetical protein
MAVNPKSTIVPTPTFDNKFGKKFSFYNYLEENKCASRNTAAGNGQTAVFAKEILP